jgi:hypothetical protein
MRIAPAVSFDTPAYDDGSLTLAEIIPDSGSVSDNLEIQNLWNDITSELPGDYVQVLRLRVNGYSDREIAKRQRKSLQDIAGIFEYIRGAAGKYAVR